jgi:hypothetical protein
LPLCTVCSFSISSQNSAAGLDPPNFCRQTLNWIWNLDSHNKITKNFHENAERSGATREYAQKLAHDRSLILFNKSKNGLLPYFFNSVCVPSIVTLEMRLDLICDVFLFFWVRHQKSLIYKRKCLEILNSVKVGSSGLGGTMSTGHMLIFCQK